MHLISHELEELGQLNLTITALIDSSYHLFNFCKFNWLLIDGLKNGPKLTRINLPITTDIENSKCFLQLRFDLGR